MIGEGVEVKSSGFSTAENSSESKNKIIVTSQIFSPETANRGEVSKFPFKHLFSPEVPAEQRMIVMVGGYPPVKAHTLEPVCREFAKAAAEQVALVAPVAEKPSPKQEAQAVLDFLKKKDIAEVILVGHSKGARLMQELALLVGDNKDSLRIRGLILTNPAGVFRQGLLNLVRSGKQQERLRAERTRFLPDADTHRIMEKQDVLDVAEGNNLRKQLRGKLSLWRNFREGRQIASMNSKVKRLDVPTFIVAGNEDTLFPKEKILKGIEQRVPKPTVLTAKKEGLHSWIMFHRPRTFAVATLGLVERHWRNQEAYAQRLVNIK